MDARENGHVRGRHACILLARPFFLAPTTSKRLGWGWIDLLSYGAPLISHVTLFPLFTDFYITLKCMLYKVLRSNQWICSSNICSLGNRIGYVLGRKVLLGNRQFIFWGSEFTCSLTWLLMTFVVNKAWKFGHLFSPTYCTCTNFETLFQVRVNLYWFSFPFAVWKLNSLKFKMSEQKFWSDFNRLYCGKTEKNIRRNMEFQQERGNLLFS